MHFFEILFIILIQISLRYASIDYKSALVEVNGLVLKGMVREQAIT